MDTVNTSSVVIMDNDKPKTTPVTVELDKATHAAFKSRCALDNLSMSEFLKNVIDDYISGRVKVKPMPPHDRKKNDKAKGA